MKKYYSFQFKAKIDNIFSISESLDNDELKANISRYLCILVSGYIEVSLKESIMSYVERTSSPTIQNFIEGTLKNMTNLKTDRIIENLSKFDSQWGKIFQENITEEQKAAIDTLIANRNQIAHGKDVGISYGNIKKYYEKTQEVIQIIENTIKNK